MKQLKPISPFYKILEVEGKSILFYYEPDSCSTYKSQVDMSKNSKLPKMSSTSTNLTKFVYTLIITIEHEGDYLDYKFELEYDCDIPRTFRDAIAEHKAEYKQYKRDFYSSIQNKELYKMLCNIENRLEKIEKKVGL